MNVLGKEVNMVKVVMTILVIIIITTLGSLIGEMFSSAKAGLAVHQLNGNDADYALSVFASRVWGIGTLVVNILLVLLIWRAELKQLLKREKTK